MKKAWGILVLTSAASLAVPADQEQFLTEVDALTTKTSSYYGEQVTAPALSHAAFSKLMHWSPRLWLSATHSYAAVTGTIPTASDSIAANGTLNIFEGGKGQFLYQAADNIYKSQLEKVKEARRGAEKAAAQLVFKKLALADEQKIYERLVKIKQDALSTVQKIYRQGKLPLQEVTKAEIDVSQSESRMRSTQMEIIDNSLDIKNLLGRDVEIKGWPLGAEQTLKVNKDPDSDSRLKQFDYSLEAFRSSYAAAKSDFSPTIDLSVGYTKPLSSAEVVLYPGWNANLTLNVPLWSQWESRSGLENAYALMKKGEFDTLQNRQTFLNQREAAQQKFELSRKNLTEAKLNLDRTHGLYSVIEKNFRLGRVSVNDLFLEQSRILDVELNYLSQLMNFHSSFVDNCLLFSETLRDCLR